MSDNYEVGDRIYIFTARYSQYHVEEGTVASITPTGRINITTATGVRRFLPPLYYSGNEIGSGNSWYPAFIRKKSEQETGAEEYRARMRAFERQHRYSKLRDSLPTQMRDKQETILTLNKLLDLVKGWDGE